MLDSVDTVKLFIYPGVFRAFVFVLEVDSIPAGGEVVDFRTGNG